MPIFLSSLLCRTARQGFENQAKRMLFYPTDLLKTSEKPGNFPK